MNICDKVAAAWMFLRLAVVVAIAAAPAVAGAQDFSDAFSGFSSRSDDPIQIEANKLEIRDAEKMAVYSGNVAVRQGPTVLRTAHLRIFYTGEATSVAPGSSVDRIEADGRVVVTARGQSASGDRAVFEMARDLITLTGNVVLSDKDNVLRGNRLVINLRTKKARIEGGRVQTILSPGKAK